MYRLLHESANRVRADTVARAKRKHCVATVFMVRRAGLEPARCNHTPLKRTRLPIPPSSRKCYYRLKKIQCQLFLVAKLLFIIYKCFTLQASRKLQSKPALLFLPIFDKSILRWCGLARLC